MSKEPQDGRRSRVVNHAVAPRDRISASQFPTITFVDASKLSPELQDILLEYDDDDYSEALNSADEDGSMVRYTAFEKELKAATIGPCSPEKVLSYYVG